MGLLDDAIREHLDLKRRRGADPAEVERAEREALGPVRRGPAEVERPVLGGEEELAYDHDGELEDWDEPFEGEPQPHQPGAAAAFTRREEFYDEDLLADEPILPDEPPTEDHGDESLPPGGPGVLPHLTPAPQAAPSSPGSHPGSGPATEGETAEYDVEDAIGQQHKPEGEDVLEETPEFLQDTPDHDRLWFEQRPPRDFDFNG